MFSALRKLVGSEQAPGRDKHIPAGLQSMNQALQRRFAKGVQYNMKIVIRGDRNTGKTALWHRLQGKQFVEEYIPTQEIQVTSIHWSYKATDDIVKVEVWDVVDKGKCKKRGDGLKVENDPQEVEAEMALDAEFLDVYKNCNGVVMMFDITKQWTFNYILRELPKVPSHVPVCVLGNYRDMGEHRVILPSDVRDFIDRLDRPPGSSYFRYAESSMKNSFGLKYLHKFFNIPFLQLQRETLLRQLETNQLDTDATLEELSVQQETEDQNYSIFLEMAEARRRGHTSPGATAGQSPPPGSQSPAGPTGTSSVGSSGSSTPQSAPQLPLGAPPSGPPQPAPAALQGSLPAPTHPPAPRRSIISRWFGTSPAADAAPPPPESAPAAPRHVHKVEDFVPEDSLDRGFLEDTAPQKEEKRGGASVPPRDSDSDGEAVGGNPMVAGFQDDVDPEDGPGRVLPPSRPVPSKDISLSSEDEAPAAALPLKVAGPAAPRGSEPDPRRVHTKASRVAPEPARPAEGTPDEKGRASSSESDPEGPIAAQMLSFVMDDPDFESGESDTQRRAAEFPVREDLSDASDEEEAAPGPVPPPRAPAPLKLQNHSDLFGLGLEPADPRGNSDQGRASKPPTKEKKKKKHQGREDDDKAGKKGRSKGRRDEGREERRRRKKEKKAADELEAFLGGGAPGGRHPGGGDYEEL